MEFENEVVLFLDLKEYYLERMQNFINEHSLGSIAVDEDEKIVSATVLGKNIDVSFILDLEYILDARITLCSRYMGSSATISSLGLS